MTLAACGASEGCGEGRKSGETHVERFEVFAHFGDELFTALVAVREVFIWRIGLGKGKEGKGGACEGKEMAYVLCGVALRGYVIVEEPRREN